jgi:hypothetical protein
MTNMTHNYGIEKCNTVRENGYGISFSSPQPWSNNTTADRTATRTQEGRSLDECKKKCNKVSEDTSDSIQSKADMDPHGYKDDTNNDSSTRRCFKRDATLPPSLHYYPSSFMYSSAEMGTNYYCCTTTPVYADNKVTPLIPLVSSEHQLHGSELHQPLFTVLFSAVILPSEPLGSKLSNTPYGIRIDEIYENSQLQGKLRPNDYIVGYGWPTTTNDTTHDITVQGLTNYLAEDLTTVNGQQFEKLVMVNRLQSFHGPLPCIEKSTVDITKNRRETSKSVESNHCGATHTSQSAIGCIQARHFFDGSKSCYSALCSGLCHSAFHHFPIYLSMCHHKPKPMTHHDQNINLCAPSITTIIPNIDNSEINRTNTRQFGIQKNICLAGSKEASAASNLYLAEGVELKNVSNHDVICGRGGLGNRHAGNRHYRQIIKDYQVQYLTAQKREKKKIAFEIMDIIHNLKPPGRFLQKDDATGLFIQIDDKRASEKISQSLREGAPKIRSSILTEKKKKKININAGCGGGEYTDHQTRSTIAQQTDMMHHEGSHLVIDSADKKLSNIIELQQEEKNDHDCTGDAPLHHHQEEGIPCKRKDTNFQDIIQTNFTIKKPRPNIVTINYN